MTVGQDFRSSSILFNLPCFILMMTVVVVKKENGRAVVVLNLCFNSKVISSESLALGHFSTNVPVLTREIVLPECHHR